MNASRDFIFDRVTGREVAAANGQIEALIGSEDGLVFSQITHAYVKAILMEAHLKRYGRRPSRNEALGYSMLADLASSQACQRLTAIFRRHQKMSGQNPDVERVIARGMAAIALRAQREFKRRDAK